MPAEYISHKFIPILIHGEMNSAKTPSTDLLLDDILINAMDGSAIIVAAAIVRPRIQSLLDALGSRGGSFMVAGRALVGRGRPWVAMSTVVHVHWAAESTYICLMGSGGWWPSWVGVAASRLMLMPGGGMIPGRGGRWDGGTGLRVVDGASVCCCWSAMLAVQQCGGRHP